VNAFAVLRTAEVIAVGSELLGSSRVDTNSLFIAEQLSSLGIALQSKTVVGDDRERIAAHLAGALSRADVVILTGGLGPTDDDLTRDAVAQVTGRSLDEQAPIVQSIAERFARRGMRMPEVNRRQALVLRGATVLDNPHGTAPGQLLEHDGRVIVLLPGPPRELRPMLTSLCDGPLGARAGRERVYRTSLFVTGRSESHVEETVQPIYSQWRTEKPPIETTILATPGQIELHLALSSADPEAARGKLERASRQLADALGRDVFSTDGRPMEEIVGALLRERRLTIAAAESCTGGLMMARLTDVPGSSAYVVGGVVSYSNDMKTGVLHVPEALLREHGAVSEPVAVTLAEGVKALTGAQIAVSITGIAGPDGGSAEKPVGTVVIAMVDAAARANVRTFRFVGGRTQVRFQASQAALEMVRRALKDEG
jgi:competence/damage-inducible protein CinA-like protein